MTRDQALREATKTAIQLKRVIYIVHELVARDDWDTPETQYGFCPWEGLGTLYRPGTCKVLGRATPDGVFRPDGEPCDSLCAAPERETMMNKVTAQELKLLREIAHFFLDGEACDFCGKPLIGAAGAAPYHEP
jgi:hypothetical protein